MAAGSRGPMGWWHLPDRSNPALTKGFELYMGRGLAACPAISGALVSGVTGGVGVTPSRGGDGVGGHGESPGAPFPSGGPVWRPQEVVGASVLCPGRGGTHMGTPGAPPQSCVRGVGAAGLIFPPKCWYGNPHPLLQVHPKRGMAWGSTLWVPNLGAAPMSWQAKPSHVVTGGKMCFGGKSQFPWCGAGPDAKGMGSHPRG